jgi:hypothetical protein
VIHHRQGLALSFEPCDNLRGIHTQIEDLDSNVTADRARLFREPDIAHSTDT